MMLSTNTLHRQSTLKALGIILRSLFQYSMLALIDDSGLPREAQNHNGSSARPSSTCNFKRPLPVPCLLSLPLRDICTSNYAPEPRTSYTCRIRIKIILLLVSFPFRSFPMLVLVLVFSFHNVSVQSLKVTAKSIPIPNHSL